MSSKKNTPAVDEGVALKGVIETGDNVELYLVRIPKHVDYAQLDGTKIKKFADQCAVESLDFPMGEHVLDAGCSMDASSFRALVKGSSSSAVIATEFAGCLSLRRVFKEPEDTNSSPPVCLTYIHKMLCFHALYTKYILYI
jgi:hypothetical protein